MSFTKKPQYFPPKITDKMIAQNVAEALRYEHAHISAMLKHIEAVTGIPAKTVSKWIEGHYAPKSRHLLTLMACYPEVLHAICDIAGMKSLWQHAVQMGLVDTMRTQLDTRWKRWQQSPAIGDKFVPIHVRVDARIAVQLNQRQLWFLGNLQQGGKMVAANIVETWCVHAKTARRDVKGLLEAKLVVAIRAGRTNQFKLS